MYHLTHATVNTNSAQFKLLFNHLCLASDGSAVSTLNNYEGISKVMIVLLPTPPSVVMPLR